MLGRPDENPYTSSSGSLSGQEEFQTPDKPIEVSVSEHHSLIAILSKTDKETAAGTSKTALN